MAANLKKQGVAEQEAMLARIFTVGRRLTLGLQSSGDVMQSQDFDVIAAHAIDGDVVPVSYTHLTLPTILRV